VNCAKKYLLWLVGLALAIGQAQANTTDFLVNDDNGVTEQDHPRIAVGNDGNFAIVWVDRRSGSADIFLQKFRTDGTRVGANRRVNDDTVTAYQSEAGIAVDLNGLYSVVWKDYRNGTYPFDPDVFIQRFDTSLSPVGVNTALTIELPDSLKETPDIALAQWGGGVVVWADYRNRNWDIYGQLINSSGARVGANFLINDDGGTAQQHAPRVAVSPEGWFVVTWYDSRNGNDDIYVQRFNASATKLGVNVKANAVTGTSRQAFPDVATDGAGHFTVVWVDWRNGVYPANPDIYARKFDTTMTALTADVMVNQDGSRRAQREPTIAADRRGNVAIIWSDSSGSTSLFDIVGQMIDVNGTVQEENFQANTSSDSTQLQADVALDGRYRYVTWADKRNGNYDIYASITQYNDPTLVPTPTGLQFEMLVGGDLPSPQQFQIDHYGYNSLNFQVLRSQNWLQVSPSSGSTPATVNVSITTDTLPYGTYYANLTLYDVSNNDSSVQVTVRLEVASPVLHLSDDTLTFAVFGGIDDQVSQTLSITNTGIGDLNWSIAESLDWLEATPDSGVNATTVTVSVNGLTLSEGSILDSIEVSAEGAGNSPTTVWLKVTVAGSQPYLQLDPDSIMLVTLDPANDSVFTVVRNVGTGSLNWSGGVAASWLVMQPGSGSDNDTVRFSVDTAGLTPGRYVTSASFADPAAYHPVVSLPFVLDYLMPGTDTVLIGDITMETGESDSLPVQLLLHNSADQIELPLTFDPHLIEVTSVSLNGSMPAFMLCSATVDTISGVVSVVISSSSADSSLSPSTYNLIWLHLTAGSSTGMFQAEEATESGLAVVVEESGLRLHLSVLPGEVRIEDPTPVEPNPTPELPSTFYLAQNYPNPFNPSTTISFQVPSLSEVQLEVFNILGQRIALIASGILPAGIYNMQWDSRLNDGRETPSGIYFYRLRAPGISLVRKMVLVK
jgi:hypothetical protein